MRYIYVSIIILFSFSFSNPSLSLDSILSSYVDSAGNVDYNGIISNPFKLNEYLDFISKVSPESHPDYFKTEDSEKAYWINVYNALILKIMIENPGKDILELGIVGHDVFLKKFIIGGKKKSPYFIENKILRKMNDPRIHFAINCASKSCPPLGNRILVGDNLNQQLDEKTFNFINNVDNVFIDYDTNTIYLSRIFKWFKKDFGNIKAYISHYLNDIDYESIKDYKIKYFKYDWSKNSL